MNRKSQTKPTEIFMFHVTDTQQDKIPLMVYIVSGWKDNER